MDYMLDPQRLWRGEQAWDAPLALVVLDSASRYPEEPALPACPLIGLGDPGHPFAKHTDCVIEAPVTLEGLTGQVLNKPHAAAVIVDLLRLMPGLDMQQGLSAESMAYGLLQGSAEHAEWMAAQAPGGTHTQEGRVEIARDGRHMKVILDRAEHGNAIDRVMRDALREAFELASLDPEIEQVSLRGEGRTFCLGADLVEFGTTTDPATAHAIRARTLPARWAAQCAGKLDVHVQGGCVGAGLEIAAFAHRMTASPGAWFQLPELAMGILPGAGGCVSLSRRIGRQRTALMVLSGKRISAKQALDWRLVDAIVDHPPGH
ncbi:MAG: enoyl-CoA hydratase/isomerase family protein [Novosphingobium sp.]